MSATVTRGLDPMGANLRRIISLSVRHRPRMRTIQ
jgi:hypothetical protein